MFEFFVEEGPTEKINDQCIFINLNLRYPQFSRRKINPQPETTSVFILAFSKLSSTFFLPVCS